MGDEVGQPLCWEGPWTPSKGFGLPSVSNRPQQQVHPVPVTQSRFPWIKPTCSDLGTAFSVGSLQESSCSWLFILFSTPVPHPDSCGQLEGRRNQYKQSWCQCLILHTIGSQARTSSSCHCFPREPSQLSFLACAEGSWWRFAILPTQAYLAFWLPRKNSSRHRNWLWGSVSSESERSPSLARKPRFPSAPQRLWSILRTVKAFYSQR